MKLQKKKKIANELENNKQELVIILVNPQLGNNIGSVARVMANFSLFKLRLVNPRSGWLNSETYSSSSGASAIIDNAGVFDDVKSAISDLDFVYATTARRRDIIKEVFLSFFREVSPARLLLLVVKKIFLKNIYFSI